MSIEQIRAILAAEAQCMRDQRIRLVTLVGLVERYMDGSELPDDEEALWQTRRRAWLMELAAIEVYLGLPRTVQPKAVRRDKRQAHGLDRRNGHGLDRRQGGPA